MYINLIVLPTLASFYDNTKFAYIVRLKSLYTLKIGVRIIEEENI